jgi:hypothetical protein
MKLSKEDINELFVKRDQPKRNLYSEFNHGIVFYDENYSIVGSISISLPENSIYMMPENLVPNLNIIKFKFLLQQYGLPDKQSSIFYRKLYELESQKFSKNINSIDDTYIEVPSDKTAQLDRIPPDLRRFYTSDISYGYSLENAIYIGIKDGEVPLFKIEEYCKNNLSASYLGNPCAWKVNKISEEKYYCAVNWEQRNLKVWFKIIPYHDKIPFPKTPVGFLDSRFLKR